MNTVLMGCKRRTHFHSYPSDIFPWLVAQYRESTGGRGEGVTAEVPHQQCVFTLSLSALPESDCWGEGGRALQLPGLYGESDCWIG